MAVTYEENRVRRMAARRGLEISRSRRAGDTGSWWLYNPTKGTAVRVGYTLADVETYLDRQGLANAS